MVHDYAAVEYLVLHSKVDKVDIDNMLKLWWGTLLLIPSFSTIKALHIFLFVQVENRNNDSLACNIDKKVWIAHNYWNITTTLISVELRLLRGAFDIKFKFLIQ